MTGNRRPSPDTQVRAALADAKRQGIPPDEAWQLATNGNVCDSYSSARGLGEAPVQPQLGNGPPNLRAAEGQRRCAGCRHVMEAGQGPARCGLYEVPIYSGVLWPHRTGERHEWRNALFGDPEDPTDRGTMDEWLAAYVDAPTTSSNAFDVVARALAGQDREDLDAESGSIAA